MNSTTMIPAKGYAVKNASSRFEPFEFQRRGLGPKDILIKIDYCGICHSDIHQAKDEWGGSIYPMVPGHEVVGHITQIGSDVKNFKVGDKAGVGCFVDSCRSCTNCDEGLEQYCQNGFVGTYNSRDKSGSPTYGGYSSQIVCDEKYTLKIPENLEFEKVAPLLCAGITTYSPLRHWKIGKNSKVAVVGLGGLGHMAVKLAASMGAEVTVLSTSASKEKDALALGAQKFAITKDSDTFEKLANTFDLIIDAVSAPHDYNQYINTLKRDGTMVLLGVPPEATAVEAFSLIGGRRSLAGSLIGGIKETQEMLDYCGKMNITSDVELVSIKNLEAAYERMIKGDVRYRFVIDMKSLG